MSGDLGPPNVMCFCNNNVQCVPKCPHRVTIISNHTCMYCMYWYKVNTVKISGTKNSFTNFSQFKVQTDIEAWASSKFKLILKHGPVQSSN